LELSASSLILVHNHPSGDSRPSAADLEITRALIAAAKTMGITVHDHLVIGCNGAESFKALGLI
jgi:DNA repair protein RadC